MISLTKDQVNILTEMANGRSFFATFASIEADGRAKDAIDRIFAEALQLIEYGLCFNVSTMPKFKAICTRYKKNEGREVFVIAPSEMVKKMFRRTPWYKTIN